VTRLCTVVIGTAFATGVLRPTINEINYLQVELRFREAGAGIHKIARSDFGPRSDPQGGGQDAQNHKFAGSEFEPTRKAS